MLYLALRNSILLLVISYFLIGCYANYTNKEDFFNSKGSSNQRLFFYDKEQSIYNRSNYYDTISYGIFIDSISYCN